MRTKLSKASVSYRKSGSESRRCGTCSMIRRVLPNWECTLVMGRIDPGDVCDRWAAKSAGIPPRRSAGPEDVTDQAWQYWEGSLKQQPRNEGKTYG
jgi:hypothetical protein